MIYIYERLIESFTQISFKNTDLFISETSDCLYERVIESLTQQICSKNTFISKQNTIPGVLYGNAQKLILLWLYLELLFPKN